MTDNNVTGGNFTNSYSIYTPEQSGWKCELFGGNGGFVWYPAKGQVPNAFWRLMQFLAFGNRWSRELNAALKEKP